jgi:hypothetical protein
VPGRSFAVSALINELALALEEFGARGMSAFADEWQGADALANRAVRVLQGEQTLEGLARGVDADGALLLDAGDGRRRILSGEVSVRPFSDRSAPMRLLFVRCRSRTSPGTLDALGCPAWRRRPQPRPREAFVLAREAPPSGRPERG